MALKLVKGTAGEADAVSEERQVSEIVAWLSRPDFEEPTAEIGSMVVYLKALDGLEVDAIQRSRILDLAQTRALKTASHIKPNLGDAGFPVPQSLRTMAQNLSDVFGAIASAHKRCMDAAEQTSGGGLRRSPVIVAARALRCLSERYQLAALLGASAPAGLWRDTHQLYREARREFGPAETLLEQALDVDRIYREMLAFAAAQPSRLSSREVMLAADYVARFAAAVEVTSKAPAEPDFRRFWLDPNLDMAPMAIARQAPPRLDDLVFVSCARLGLLAAEQVRELEAGTQVDNLHLPPEAKEPIYRGMLQRLHDSWVEPPTRRLVRRRQNYHVDVCIGFPAVLGLFGQKPGDAAAQPTDRSDWVVLNESPAGFSIVHMKGHVEWLETGGLLALRRRDARLWDLCVIRWLRSDSPEHAEAGVQVISSGARSVRVAFRNTKTPQLPVDGLLVPAVPAIRAHEAILVPAGTCSSRRFLLVTESDRTQIVQGRMVNLDIQTASLELFEFQPDPYPI